jgi:hypothetical protein
MMSDIAGGTAHQPAPQPYESIRASLRARRNDDAIVKLCAIVVTRPDDLAAKEFTRAPPLYWTSILDLAVCGKTWKLKFFSLLRVIAFGVFDPFEALFGGLNSPPAYAAISLGMRIRL